MVAKDDMIRTRIEDVTVVTIVCLILLFLAWVAALALQSDSTPLPEITPPVYNTLETTP